MEDERSARVPPVDVPLEVGGHDLFAPVTEQVARRARDMIASRRLQRMAREPAGRNLLQINDGIEPLLCELADPETTDAILMTGGTGIAARPTARDA